MGARDIPRGGPTSLVSYVLLRKRSTSPRHQAVALRRRLPPPTSLGRRVAVKTPQRHWCAAPLARGPRRRALRGRGRTPGCVRAPRLDGSVLGALQRISHLIFEGKAHQGEIPLLNKPCCFSRCIPFFYPAERASGVRCGVRGALGNVGGRGFALRSPLPSKLASTPSLGLPAIQNLLLSDLMAKRSSGHMLNHLVTKTLNQQNKHCAYRGKTFFFLLC